MRKPHEVLKGRPETPDAYMSLLMQKAQRNRARVRLSSTALVAYVSDGRWVADCPSCNAGIAIHPEWHVAGCFECYTQYQRITVPGQWQDVEVALQPRPLRNQNWLPHETVSDLRIENAARGVR